MARNRSSSETLRAGMRIGHHYMLMEPLGSGFTSQVWRASVVTAPDGVDLRRGQDVALKIYSKNGQFVRLEREWSIAHAIEDVNVVRVHDAVWAPTRPHHPFLVMEYIDGDTLKSQITQAGDGLGIYTSLRIGLQILSGLKAIHAENAVHRDIKPGNVMVVGEGPGQVAKILDLGIVALVDPDFTLTGSGALMGSKHYASPEQLRGEKATVKSDIYNFGATMIHCIMGRPMYRSCQTPAAVGMEMMRKPEHVSRDIGPSWARGILDFLGECISLDQDKRPKDAETAHARLAGLIAQAEVEFRKRAEMRKTETPASPAAPATGYPPIMAGQPMLPGQQPMMMPGQMPGQLMPGQMMPGQTPGQLMPGQMPGQMPGFNPMAQFMEMMQAAMYPGMGVPTQLSTPTQAATTTPTKTTSDKPESTTYGSGPKT